MSAFRAKADMRWANPLLCKIGNTSFAMVAFTAGWLTGGLTCWMGLRWPGPIETAFKRKPPVGPHFRGSGVRRSPREVVTPVLLYSEGVTGHPKRLDKSTPCA